MEISWPILELIDEINYSLHRKIVFLPSKKKKKDSIPSQRIM